MLVAVVGAGIMGASLALHFAANEMTVLLFDGAVPGSGATGSSFACLNFFAASTSDYMQFRSEALDYHMELARPIGLVDAIRATGTLRWSTDTTQNKKLLQAASMAEGLGRTVEYLSRSDALNLEPNLSLVGSPEVIVAGSSGGMARLCLFHEAHDRRCRRNRANPLGLGKMYKDRASQPRRGGLD
ncbi:glycine/D-amino acid oxidase-like deaminating enzyme [Bradyrhizobium sp. F1.13.1]